MSLSKISGVVYAKSCVAFRHWQRTKFPRKKRYQSEVKFSDAGISDALRIKTVQHICEMGVRVTCGVARWHEIPGRFFVDGKIKEGLLYTYMVGEVLAAQFPLREELIHVRCDRRNVQGMHGEEFCQRIAARLARSAMAGARIDVQQIDSTSDANVQIVDWIVGALAAVAHGKPLAEEYLKILTPCIIGRVDFFRKQKTQPRD